MVKERTLGIIGLGKMGGNLALQANEKGIKVVGKEKKKNPRLSRQGIKIETDYEKFFNNFDRPRVIYLSLPAGKIIDKVINELLPFLDKGDVLMDGGNSFYLDSIRREKELSKDGITF